MDLLLDLVERQRIDLGQMSILALVEQFLAAFDQLRDRVAIERRADWLVMATRLVLLRSRLLFPESPEAAKAAEQEAAFALRRLDELVAMRAAAVWLGTQPILGETVFARGLPERTGLLLGTEHAVDVIAFLWASLALFEDDAPDPDTVTRYRPSWSNLYSVTEVQDRILRILGEGGDGEELERVLPDPPVPTPLILGCCRLAALRHRPLGPFYIWVKAFIRRQLTSEVGGSIACCAEDLAIGEAVDTRPRPRVGRTVRNTLTSGMTYVLAAPAVLPNPARRFYPQRCGSLRPRDRNPPSSEDVPNLKTRSPPMATICSFQRVINNETAVSPHHSTDREMELAAIIAAAELAFDQVFRARQDIAA